MCLGIGNSIVQDDQVGLVFFALVVNMFCILFTFVKFKLLTVKLLPTPEVLPNHRTSFSLTEGCTDFVGTSALTTFI